MLNGKTILITGGTGSFGQKFVETVLRDYPSVKKVIIYSRGESAQYDMQQRYPKKQFSQLRFFIGDIRDKERLTRACEDVDILIHAAAISQPETAEYNPEECLKTNVLGAKNIIDSALECDIKNVVALSSDKACAPINLYGASQLLSDKLFVAANNIKGGRNIKYSVVRYGNVLGSRGSVIPYFMHRRDMNASRLPITDKRMTRFTITQQAAVDMVIYAISKQLGGEIFIPKCASYRITDVATAVAPNIPQEETGIRPNEKLHEQMFTSDDAVNTIEIDNAYIIVPAVAYTDNRCKDTYLSHYKAACVPDDFSYKSDTNSEWETVESLREKIRQYIYPNFKVK